MAERAKQVRDNGHGPIFPMNPSVSPSKLHLNDHHEPAREESNGIMVANGGEKPQANESGRLSDKLCLLADGFHGLRAILSLPFIR